MTKLSSRRLSVCEKNYIRFNMQQRSCHLDIVHISFINNQEVKQNNCPVSFRSSCLVLFYSKLLPIKFISLCVLLGSICMMSRVGSIFLLKTNPTSKISTPLWSNNQSNDLKYLGRAITHLFYETALLLNAGIICQPNMHKLKIKQCYCYLDFSMYQFIGPYITNIQ